MKFTNLVPKSTAHVLKIWRLKRKFPIAEYIRSSEINLRALLGRGVGIGPDVIINGNVSIGENTYVNRGSIIFSGSIGKYCSIGHYVLIGGESHPLHHLSTSPRMRGVTTGYSEFEAPPIIGSDVWIAAGASVLQGVIVGDGSVIAAGAVVTRDVRPYSIVGGVPAKEIGSRFDDATIEFLLQWRWWDLNPIELDDAKKIAGLGQDWVEAARSCFLSQAKLKAVSVDPK